MNYTIQSNTQVQIVEKEHELNGKIRYVTGTQGEKSSNGTEIPEGWVEVRVEMDFHELFREENVIPTDYLI